MIAYKVFEKRAEYHFVEFIIHVNAWLIVFWSCRLYLDDKYQQNDKSFVNTFIDILIVGLNTATHS